MLQYVITDGSRFIYRNHNNKFVPTSSEVMADIYSKEKAENIYNNSIPKALKRKFYLKEYYNPPKIIKKVDKEKHNAEDTTYSDDIKQWLDKIDTLNGLVEQASIRQEELIKKLSNIDQELSDVFHYIEFCDLNAAQGYNAYKMIKERRMKRRIIKNELELVSAISNKKVTVCMESEIEKIIENIQARTYKPRVLKNLFS